MLRSDVVIAELDAVIFDRARWPGAPLVGAAENWLRPGVWATMASEAVDSEAQVQGIRTAVRPAGMLDSLDGRKAFAAHIAEQVHELRMMGQSEAAMALQAEHVLDKAEAEAMAQFQAVVDARVIAERPAVPAWVGGGRRWSSDVVLSEFGSPDEDALKALGLVSLSERIDALTQARGEAEDALRWLGAYSYPLPTAADGVTERSIRSRGSMVLSGLLTAAKSATRFVALPVDEWVAPDIRRTAFDVLALRSPALAADMMSKGVRVIDA